MANNDTAQHNNKSNQALIIKIGKRLRNSVNRISSSQSLIPTKPVQDNDLFSWTDDLAEHWNAIAAEARHILHHRDAIPPLKDISPDHARIAADGNWRSFFLYGYGYRVEDNCRRAPVTAQLADKIPDLNSAFFSILEPGAVIPLHRGVTRGLVTCHLGLSIPKDGENCWMKVDDETVHWQNGEWLIFDDSYFHEVANDTDETRIILLVQVKRPMKWLGKLTNDLALWGIRRSPFVQDARQNLEHWEDAFKQAEDNEAA